MSNQGVRGFYQVTQTIKDELLTDENINTVTTGDITEVDLSNVYEGEDNTDLTGELACAGGACEIT